MRKLFLFLIVAFAFTQARAQYVHKIKADSVLITNDSCTAELNLENSTKHVKGFLYNKGNGRTEFRKVTKLNDTMFVIGDDTLAFGENFENGLTRTGNNVRLGGALIQPTTINTSGANTLTVAGAATSLSNPLFSINNTAGLFETGYALDINGSAGIGLNLRTDFLGMNITGFGSGLSVWSQGNMASSFTSDAGSAGWFFRNGTTNSLQEVIGIRRQTNTGPAANGIGGMISFYTQTTGTGGGNNRVSTQLESIWVNAGDSVRSALFGITLPFPGTNARSEVAKFFSPGNVQFPKYAGTTFNVNDTVTYKPMVMDASGNIRKFDSWSGGGGSGGSGMAWSLPGNAGTNPTSNFIGTTDNQDVAFRTNNIERMRVATTGKVGIGTTNPLYKLDLRNSTDSTWTTIHISRDSTDTGGYIGIAQPSVMVLSSDATANTYNSGWIAKGTSAAMMSIASGNGPQPNFGFFLNTGLTPGQAFGPWSIMQMNGGDVFGSMRGVGVGTPISWHRLHVSHSDSNLVGLENTGALSATSGSLLRMYNKGTPSAGGQRLGGLAWGTGGSISGMRTGARIQAFSESSWTDNVSQPTYLNFETSPVNANSPVERMRITSAGNIGIGTATPAYKLDVNGKLGVRTIDSTATAANILYQDPATGEIKKAGKQSFAQTANATVASTNSELTLVSSGTGSLTIPASAWFAGKSFRISVRGVYSTSASDPAGITIKIKLGSTVIAQSASMFLGSGKTDVSYEIRADLTCRAAGASGSLYTMGMFYNDDDIHSKIDNIPTTINLSGNQTLDITATLSDDAAGNSISAFILTFEAIN